MNTKDTVKKLLAEQIGVEPDDIGEEDFLIEDLHMSPADLTDFVEKLEASGFPTHGLDLTEIETVEDLLEKLSSEEIP